MFLEVISPLSLFLFLPLNRIFFFFFVICMFFLYFISMQPNIPLTYIFVSVVTSGTSFFFIPQQVKYKTKWAGFKRQEMEPNEIQDGPKLTLAMRGWTAWGTQQFSKISKMPLWVFLVTNSRLTFSFLQCFFSLHKTALP